jgi:hypothetical protein
MEKVKAAVSLGEDTSGKNDNGSSNTDTIIARHDAACTAMALFTDAIADMAAETEDAQIIKIALYANRTASEWHRLGDILPTVLQLALHARAASEAGQR